MSEELAGLYEVQQADTEMARLQDELASLETGDELAREIAAAESELRALRDRRQATEKESLDCDLELKTLEEKKAKFEAQLYSGTVHNPRQLTDLQGEVQMLSREITKVEDRVLDLMESLEADGSEIASRESQLEDQRGRLASLREEYGERHSRLSREVDELQQRRKELAGRVRAPLLKRYEQIRARQGNLGLVKVAANTCPGCRIALPSETIKALQADRGTLTCENCGRMLFWDGSSS